MSREIKFRDYDVDTKQIRYFDLDSYDRYEHDNYGNIMQYTGLKDNNGKEIYEGDIIYIPLYGNAIIIWNDDVCSFQYAYHAIGKGTSIGGRMTNTMYKHESIIKYEIIGNIYQNPELLNK